MGECLATNQRFDTVKSHKRLILYNKAHTTCKISTQKFKKSLIFISCVIKYLHAIEYSYVTDVFNKSQLSMLLYAICINFHPAVLHCSERVIKSRFNFQPFAFRVSS